MTEYAEPRRDGPPPMSSDEYWRRVRQQWNQLVTTGARTDERALQQFIERHPSMLIPTDAQNHDLHTRSIEFGAVFSQPPLAGYTRRIPDFCWFGFNSAYIHPTFVEIETPSKRWFREDGVPHSDLTAAHDQLAEWKTWWTENRAAFIDAFQLRQAQGLHFDGMTVEPKYILIHGSREEFNDRPSLNKKRAGLRRPDETLMTFDRLPLGYAEDWVLSARLGRDSFEVLHVPPTFCVGPTFASEYRFFSGFDDAVDRSEWMSPERKTFLKERWNYWRDHQTAFCSTGLE